MIITDDKVQFEDADFAGLSDFARKALIFYAGKSNDTTGNPFPTFLEMLASDVNRKIELSKTALSSVSFNQPDVVAIARGLAIADAAQLQAAQPCIDQLKLVLPSISATK